MALDSSDWLCNSLFILIALMVSTTYFHCPPWLHSTCLPTVGVPGDSVCREREGKREGEGGEGDEEGEGREG